METKTRIDNAKEFEVVRTTVFYGALFFPFIFALILLVQAYRENSFQIFSDFFWIIFFLTILSVWSESVSRFSKIDYLKREVFIRDGLANNIHIKENTIQEIKTKGRTNWVIFKKEMNQKSYVIPRLFYTPKQVERVISAILDFNPEAKRNYYANSGELIK